MKFAAEVLVLVLMILSNGRVFSIKKTKIDSMVMLSPLAFLVAVLTIVAFEVDVFTLIILILSVFVLLSNFHALFRISSKLYVDHYSVLMKIWAFFTVLFSLIILAALVYFRPGFVNLKKSGIVESKHFYSGTFSTGFSETEHFGKADVFLHKYVPSESATADVKTTVLFIPDKRGDTDAYVPYLANLTSLGYEIYSADFYAKDGKWLHTSGDSRVLRRSSLIFQSINDSYNYEAQKEFYTYNFLRELEAELKLLSEKEIDKIFIVTDYTGFDAAKDIMKKYPERVQGIFDISSINDSYDTPGFGFVSTVNPLLAMQLGKKTDRVGISPMICANRTDEAIKAELKKTENEMAASVKKEAALLEDNNDTESAL